MLEDGIRTIYVVKRRVRKAKIGMTNDSILPVVVRESIV
jgi:hypothetical protein